MNPFLMSREERLHHWKVFRNGLVIYDEPTQLALVAQYWAQAPLSKFAYDTERPEEWPGPWEMVMAGEWCRDCVAIGMEFTLRLAGWSADRFTLVMMRDYDISNQILVLKIDNGNLLNYSVGEVVHYPSTNHDVLARYRFNGRGYISI